MTLKSPFPWFGGKSRAATMIWARLGDCRNYIEPFAGSLAVLLARPTPPGVNRKLPHLGTAGRGVNRKWSCADLHARLQNVRVACGDWSRICGPAVTRVGSPCGIVLDPPYDDGCDVYAEQNRVSRDVREWAREAGKDRANRIALCGYSGDHDELLSHGWDVEEWRAQGGYGNQSDKNGRANAKRERVWLSPGCLPRAQTRLI